MEHRKEGIKAKRVEESKRNDVTNRAQKRSIEKAVAIIL